MCELDLPACPICLARGSLSRETLEEYVWYECRECGSALQRAGNKQWAYQTITRDDKAYLLKRSMTVEDLRGLLLQRGLGAPVVDSAEVHGEQDHAQGAVGISFPKKTCPYCAEDIEVEAVVCRYCGRDSTRPPSLPTHEAPSNERPKRKWLKAVALTVAIVLTLVIVLKVGFYTIQPIGALPEGKTLIIWRNAGEPFFNSPDAECLSRLGYVSLLCRGARLGQAPTERIIVRLPYLRWAYLRSTGGQEFDR